LEELAAEVFAPLVRRDQRDRGTTYVRGLLLDGWRKSMQPMAERLDVDHQRLQQFVRRGGEDCLVSFESSRYSVPATEVTVGMTVELRVGSVTVSIHAIGADPRLLVEHPRARHRGDDQIDPAHWDALPDGRTRAITLTDTDPSPGGPRPSGSSRWQCCSTRPGMGVAVARRDPRVYDAAAGLTGQIGGAAWTSAPTAWWPSRRTERRVQDTDGVRLGTCDEPRPRGGGRAAAPGTPDPVTL
jgi:hypothetical protein